ncbi:hypothetical protein FKP32DRAFT_1609544 [Trametes sanguinea]|nr:hypothetical protein FKP32DRAFT_1609544 [Trametes sanguinea]
MNVDHDGSSPPHPSSKPRKRKSMDAPHAEQETNTDHVPSKAKKAKNDTIVERTYTTGGAAQTNQDVTRKDSGALPHAGRCHQCTRPVDPSVSVRCTALRPTGKQCVFKYCKACMRNRYQQDINTIKSRGVKIPTEERSKHATDIDYVFRCPRCEDICNCRSCRKGKGLPATGDLHLLARKAAQLSAAPKPSTQLDESGLPSQVNTSTAAMSVTTIPKPRAFKLKPHVLIPPDPSSAEKAKRRPNHPKREVAPKVVPEPVWTPLPTPLNYEGARERIHVREFLLRFSHLTEIARGHLEELEDVGSSTLGDRGVEEEEEEARSSKASVTTWISEASLKGIFVGLLTLLSKDPEQEQHVQALTKAIQSIKSAGVNLNRMSAALITLRENSSIALPGPLPFASTVRHSRRSGSLAQEASQHSVFSSAQLVPAVSALVDQALQTKAVREDFERAVSQEKDLARAMRELTVEENKRWKSTLDAKNTTPAHRKAARVAHKEALAAIEHAHKVAMSECVPRFAPLGRDTDGRVYFALTPGMIEREAAVDLLEGGTGEVRWGKRRGVADEAQRKRLRHWSWFLAVYGRKPEGAQVANSVGGDGNVGVGAEEEDGDAEGWWGFWQPEEVAKLSEWLAAKYGIDIEAKRLPKASNEGTATKPRGRPSNASSAADTSYEASSSRFRSFASLNRDSSDYEAEYAPSSNSSHAEDELYMRVDAGGEPVPTRQDLVGLVRGLVDYADLLDWRIKHASKDTKGTPIEVNKAGKGKSVEVEQAIPTQSFYGGK